jgi:hypothetical protein
MSPGGRTTRRLHVANGRGTITRRPTEPGTVHVRVRVEGLDGTPTTGRASFDVLSAPPAVRIVSAPAQAVAGEPVRVEFRVRNGVRESAEVTTRSGIVVSRRYLIRDGTGVLTWTPPAPGRSVLVVRVVGKQGQVARKTLRIDVSPRPPSAPTPSVELLDVPRNSTVGVPSTIVFRADGCTAAVARIEGPADDNTVVRFPCPAPRATFRWTPTKPGRYELTVIARGGGTTVQASTRLRAESP